MLKPGSESVVESPNRDEVERHIEHVFASPEFCQSRRCQQFLGYVTHRALEGRHDLLKERSLATELFGRPADWDPSDDTIVRVSAREVRRRLTQFYSSDHGTHEPVRIVLSPGSYIPEFHQVEPPSQQNSTAGTQPAQARPWWLVPLAVVVVIASATLFWHRVKPGATAAADEFWSPAWKGSAPLLIALPNPIVYLPSQEVEARDRERIPKYDTPLQHLLRIPTSQLNASDFFGVEDQFVGFGDAVSSSEVAAVSMQHGHAARLRLASKLEFADLQEGPTFLIGAFTNRWTLEFTKNLRFYFDYTPGHKAAIFDRRTGRSWINPNRQDNQSASEDYLLVCRLKNSPTGKFVVIAAGLMQFGTEAAGKLVANPTDLENVLKQLGNSWKGHNTEMVLYARIIDNSPSPAGLVAWQVW